MINNNYIVERDRVVFENGETLQRHLHIEYKDQLVVRGCDFCCDTGFDLDSFANNESRACFFCNSLPTILTRQSKTTTENNWIKGIKKVKAKWCGGYRTIDHVNTIVIHRYAFGRGDAGPRYVRDPHGRHVSWHYTVHYENFKRNVTQHLPIDQIGWHAGIHIANERSIGIEIDAAKDSDPHSHYDEQTIKNLIDLIMQLKEIAPSIKSICGHVDIVPKRRVDPGKKFPWRFVENAVSLKRSTHLLSA